MKKSIKKRTSKEEKLTKEMCIRKERGQQKHKIWKPGRNKAIVAEEMEQHHGERDDKLQSKVWDSG